MSKVRAISFEEFDCGKKLASSKKRFKWVFSIGQDKHTLEILNSALSGKRIVNLDSKQIYAEKDVLNIKFDFSHLLDGHNIRISMKPDTVNLFDLRIDNRDFSSLYGKVQQKTEEKKQDSYDPFSDFSNLANSKTQQEKPKNNDFGDFDLESFQSQKKSGKENFVPTVKNNQPQIEFKNFQTNQFQTNGINDFANNFYKLEQNNVCESDFATNTFNNCNNFMDLMNHREQSSQMFSNNIALPPSRFEKGSIGDQMNLHDIKIDITAKQMVNKIKIMAESAKNKVVQLTDSLI